LTLPLLDAIYQQCVRSAKSMFCEPSEPTFLGGL
jgi:hypothetical protein